MQTDINKISLYYILDKISNELQKEKITNGSIKIVISAYSHIKEHLLFKLYEKVNIPIIEDYGNYTFYIYDDFYINKNYHEYSHIEIPLQSGNGKFRIDYYKIFKEE